MEGKKYNIEILNDYVKRGLLEKNEHPSLPISIYNYSRECQFNKSWDDVTLNMRGTIIDNEGNVIASSFSKFFNYEEVKGQIPLKGDYVYVQEKIDGSLGILFWYNDDWHLATKGSFSSDQAKRGLEIIKRKYKLDSFFREYTYILEIVYPENRIVVDYGKEEKVVFISITYKGEELHWSTSLGVFKASGIKKLDTVKTEQHFSFGESLYNTLKEMDTKNSEGFVLRFHPGNFRMKIKFDEYVRLHRILTNFSNVDIWEHLRDGKDINEFLKNVPDEFDQWVKRIISQLNYNKYLIGETAGKIHDHYRYGKYNDRKIEPTKKQFVEYLEFIKVNPGIKAVCLSMWDNKKYDRIIWKMVRPSYQKPFWNREE